MPFTFECMYIAVYKVFFVIALLVGGGVSAVSNILESFFFLSLRLHFGNRPTWRVSGVVELASSIQWCVS